MRFIFITLIMCLSCFADTETDKIKQKINNLGADYHSIRQSAHDCLRHVRDIEDLERKLLLLNVKKLQTLNDPEYQLATEKLLHEIIPKYHMHSYVDFDCSPSYITKEYIDKYQLKINTKKEQINVLMVNNIKEDSEAYKSGLRNTDTIVSINGKLADGMDDISWLDGTDPLFFLLRTRGQFHTLELLVFSPSTENVGVLEVKTKKMKKITIKLKYEQPTFYPSRQEEMINKKCFNLIYKFWEDKAKECIKKEAKK